MKHQLYDISYQGLESELHLRKVVLGFSFLIGSGQNELTDGKHQTLQTFLIHPM